MNMAEVDTLILGIDLGTDQCSVIANNGYQSSTSSIIGYPKDIVSLKHLGRQQVFGEDVIKYRTCCETYHPLDGGVISTTNFHDYNAVYELLRHLIQEASAGFDGEVCAVIGVPARASLVNQDILTRLADELLQTVLIVSEPFMVAYELGKLSNAIIVDIGAGTVDICAMKGTVPHVEDQVSLSKAGHYIDKQLALLIEEKYPEFDVTLPLMKRIKDSHSFVSEYGSEALVTMRDEGRPVSVDLSEEIRLACELIIPDLLEHLTTLVRKFDPEFQHEVLENIFISGGGSSIRGIDEVIAWHLVEYGDVDVQCIDPDGFAGARGALKLAMDLPTEVWNQVGFIKNGASLGEILKN
jgi:rod shape-determining protein MreB